MTNCLLNGQSEHPIIIRPYQTAKPKLNGALSLGGSYYVLRDVEIYWDGWTGRESAQSGSDPTDLVMENLGGGGVYLKLINCVIHDLSGPMFGSDALGLEVNGCVIYHNGWSAPDRGHGHGLYIQNDTPEKIIKDSIIFDDFGYGIHAYTQSGAIDNITLDGCTCFNNGSLYGVENNNILVGGLQVANNVLVQGCMTYGAGVNIGYSAGANGSLLNNYFPGGITKVNATLTEDGNYYGPDTGNHVFVRPNDYQTDRANVTIYNEAEAEVISVDLSAVAGLSAGDGVTVRNVQDYFVDIQTRTLDADKKITVDMLEQNRTVSTPIQWTAPATTFPGFGCFVIERIN